MTVRVERTFEVSAPPERVWAFISDHEKRAGAISVVESFDAEDDRHATWHVSLPIPVINRTVPVETEDTDREEPRYARFVGRSRAMRVIGEHELRGLDAGDKEVDDPGSTERTRLTNRFLVDGNLPGVERFFKRNLDDELRNLQHAIGRDLGVETTSR
ncbi:polyketide cyclase [Halobacteriales archaeon QH_8_64_26]|nr:MAG: polyketide cyclase [Halobacteriales archaeon QH_8_64_26]